MLHVFERHLGLARTLFLLEVLCFFIYSIYKADSDQGHLANI